MEAEKRDPGNDVASAPGFSASSGDTVSFLLVNRRSSLSRQLICDVPGDGAGVGKGRTVAGIIYENYLSGRKRTLWFSVSNDLKCDAERDLNDIGCSSDVSLLDKFKYKAKLSLKVNGKVKNGVVFATYSSLIGERQGQEKYNTRMSQLLNWFADACLSLCIYFTISKGVTISSP
ncbi:protein strawberry notch homolog 1-like isoform X2 [Acropora millepora]|uniref:protein strawberry notch homolog 1-like isoform X2 n=1 Tax=Acropora millepora TaxID=45264 RepID=UPI001CF5DB41|nr:protein strawberry notch homolog 1-like isoform X2 [Acropora millepora]